MSNHSAERRRHPRYDLIAQVRVKRGRVDYVLELSNISMSGALIELGSLETPKWVEIGRELEVHIVHPIDLDAIEVPARVVRVEGTATRFAVEFEEVEAATEAGLARLIAAASGRASAEPPPLPA
jgi:c-di-GMP-binding flagellar brake protein YcgR